MAVRQDALYDLRAAPALPLVCGRCSRAGKRSRGRWPSVRLRENVDAEGNSHAQLTYRCDTRCRRTYRIDFDAMQQACLDTARAGHSLVALDIE